MPALDDLRALQDAAAPKGIVSVCSAHPLVLRAALRQAAWTGEPALIEATCNQVDHRGGYTGMTPEDFAALVRRIAQEEGARFTLGGDHLGPNPWRGRPAAEAMIEAEEMTRAYAAAGFGKIHLDASMGCAGEPEALGDEETARRAARLAAAAETAAARAGHPPPRYVIGTEVPPPGGADHELSAVAPTDPDAARHTYRIHRETFESQGLRDAFARVRGLVVQPGVEFGNRNVVRYDPRAARGLSAALSDMPGLVFEAHSTDYQGEAPLRALIADGFAVLKVGPELTFALREALYGLDGIASDLVGGYGERPLKAAMETLMVKRPGDWQRHYDGADARWLRHHSLSDRIRYYWPEAEAPVTRLMEVLRGVSVPLPLLWQHLPWAEAFADAPLVPEDVVIERVLRVLRSYSAACG